MRITLTFLLLPALLLVGAACSGGTSESADPSGDAGAAADSASGSDAGNADVLQSDASTPKDSRIDPLGPGYEWNYNVKILGDYPLCTAGAQQGKILGMMSHEGKYGYRLQSLCPSAGVSDYFASGDKVEVRVLEAGSWELALDTPVAEGHTWTNSYGTFAWHAIPSEKVGGTLQGECWQAKDENGATYTNYCRGVGPTHWHIEDKSGNGYDAVLTSVNF